jgi:hypothetical protein
MVSARSIVRRSATIGYRGPDGELRPRREEVGGGFEVQPTVGQLNAKPRVSKMQAANDGPR